MEENKNSDFKGKSNSIENSNHRQGGSNYHTGSSNSNSWPGPSNANPRQVSSNSLPHTSTSSNHWQERDRQPPKKRSHSENDDWGTSQGTFTLNPFSMMPMNSQWSVNHAVPTVASNCASTSGIGMPMETVSPAMGAFPHMNIGNIDPSMWNGMMPGFLQTMMQMFPQYQIANNQDAIIPMFNNLEPLIITHAVLTPPLPGEKRAHRQKPNGCRTVYVGMLPEKITEEIIREAFQICGPISVIRMTKRNFCHIRFVNMESVDQALLLSGFRIRIDESEDPAFNGRLHVEYAIARDDQHDWECLERVRQREERHRQDYRPLSPPPPIPNYSEHEAQSLAERLRNEETFREGLHVLTTWLDRGECNKRNSGSFYSLIQSSHSHVKRLRNEKSRFKEEAEKANENLENKNRSIERDMNEIEKVFVAAKTQKVWDHFTRSQRKKMEEMKNDTCELKQTNSEDLVGKRKDEEMELSDTEDRNDNEAEDIKESATEELNVMREKVFSLTEDVDTCHQEIENYRRLEAELREEIARIEFELEECKKHRRGGNDSPGSFDRQFCDISTQRGPSRVDSIPNENALICAISIFLSIHPFGASIDYICSYLDKTFPDVNARDVETLMRRFPNIFREVSTGIGATLEKKWNYLPFYNRD